VIAHVLCSRGYDLPWSAVSVSVQQDMLEDADAILAAVAPLIRAAALEEAAEAANKLGIERWHGTALEDACDEVAAAIRALDTPPPADG
jgi:hypothetical protein